MGTCSRAAFRNSQADMSHIAAKKPVSAGTSGDHTNAFDSGQKVDAITGTRAWASAVLLMAGAIPAGRKRAMIAPMSATARTPP